MIIKEVLSSEKYESLIRGMYDVHKYHQNNQDAPESLYDEQEFLYTEIDETLSEEDSKIFLVITNLASSSFCFSRTNTLPEVKEISSEFCEFLLNIDNLPPIEALNKLKQISKKLPRSISLENRAKQFLRIGDKTTHDILMKEANRHYIYATDAK